MNMSETSAFVPSRRFAPAEGYAWILALLLGLAALWIALGSPVSVVNRTFVFDSDYPNAAAAFEVFVRDIWRYPLGDNPQFGGVNLFFSDAAPWFALLAKAVYGVTGIFIPFDALILVNFLLFSIMAYRWACRLGADMQGRWLITLLLVFSLIMPVRTLGAQHIALSGYWVLLWAMCCVTPDLRGVTSPFRRWECVAVATMAFLSHSYLGAMAVGFMLVVLVLRRQWIQVVGMLALPLFALYLFGFFDSKYATIPGAKEFSLDLLAFAQTLNWAIVPSLYPVSTPQADIVVYLGTGAWALMLMCLVAWVWVWLQNRGNNPARMASSTSEVPLPHSYLYLAAIALAIFALALNLRVAGTVWVSVPFFEPFAALYERFRSPGRFGAPLAYMAVVTAAIVWLRLRPRIAPVIWWLGTLVAICLQMGDLKVAGDKVSLVSPEAYQAKVQHEQISSLLRNMPWSGNVFKDVGYYELEEQRLLDRLLVQYGATRFSVVHGARLDPDEVRERSRLIQTAQPGDVTVTRLEDSAACQGKKVQIKTFSVCLLQ